MTASVEVVHGRLWTYQGRRCRCEECRAVRTYRNWGCRCRPCTDANAAASQRNRDKARAAGRLAS